VATIIRIVALVWMPTTGSRMKPVASDPHTAPHVFAR